MKIHSIMHASFEGLGTIEKWSLANGHSLTKTNTSQGEILPVETDFDFLIVMGGPQSPLEFGKYPYLRDEVKFIKKAIKQHKKIFRYLFRCPTYR